jgi:hypothetical protein
MYQVFEDSIEKKRKVRNETDIKKGSVDKLIAREVSFTNSVSILLTVIHR